MISLAYVDTRTAVSLEIESAMSSRAKASACICTADFERSHERACQNQLFICMITCACKI